MAENDEPQVEDTGLTRAEKATADAKVLDAALKEQATQKGKSQDAALKAAQRPQPQTKLEAAADEAARAKGSARVAPHTNLTVAASETVANENAARALAEAASKDETVAERATAPAGFGDGGSDTSTSVSPGLLGDEAIRQMLAEIEALKARVATQDEKLAGQISVPAAPVVPPMPIGVYGSGMAQIPMSPMDVQAARLNYQAQSELAGRKIRTNEAPNGTCFKVPQINPVTGDLIGYVWMDGKGNQVEAPKG